jgi:hypothetical protein
LVINTSRIPLAWYLLEDIVRNTLLLPLTLCAAIGTVFAQDLPPTGVVRSGDIQLFRSSSQFTFDPFGTISTVTDTASGAFYMIDYGEPTGIDPPAVTTIGACTVVSLGVSPPINPPAVVILDAGPVLNLAGPNGSTQIPATQFAFGATLGGGTTYPDFLGLPPPPPLYLDAGTYTIDNGDGGADVGPFMASLNIPAQFIWSNPDAAASIDRSAGLEVLWTGGDPDSQVKIIGGAAVIDPATGQLASGAFFTCTETNSVSYFFVPPEVLAFVPASAVAGVPNGSLSVNNGVKVTFEASGVDQSTFTFTSSSTRTPEYR